MALVDAAGPLSNFALAFLALAARALADRHLETPFFADPVLGVLFYAYLFNLGLGIFNLIPLPPLDGGHFLPYIFPGASWTVLRQLEQYGPLILILAVMTGATRYIMGPMLVVMNRLFVWLVSVIL
jgi:Zn-dependent protease